MGAPVEVQLQNLTDFMEWLRQQTCTGCKTWNSKRRPQLSDEHVGMTRYKKKNEVEAQKDELRFHLMQVNIWLFSGQ